MLTSAIAAGLVAGLLTGGRLERLASLRIRWWPLLVIGLGIRVVAQVVGELPLPAYLAAFVSIAAVAFADRRITGMPWIFAGALANLVVVALNGAMPVDPFAASIAGTTIPSDGLHREMAAGDRLPFLADVLPFPPIARVYSLGDLALAWGAFTLVFVHLRRPAP